MRLRVQCGMFFIAMALVCCLNPDLLPAVSARSRSQIEPLSINRNPTHQRTPKLASITKRIPSIKPNSSKNSATSSSPKFATPRKPATTTPLARSWKSTATTREPRSTALKKEHPNAEHQINGYKQLQIHIRRAIRDLKETVLLAPGRVQASTPIGRARPGFNR